MYFADLCFHSKGDDMTKSIAVLTSGGDAPGMNAAMHEPSSGWGSPTDIPSLGSTEAWKN